MATFGTNMRITVAKEHRALARQVFAEVFGCQVKTPSDNLEVYLFDDGFSIGAYFVDADQALSTKEHARAPWLEILVQDPEKTQAALAKLGIEPFEYVDKTHRYFAPPSGPVFRLATKK
jgi:hypothetical protein